MAAGAFCGLLMSPDLDVDEGSRSEYFVRGVSGLLEKIWWGYWWPYRKIPHRSFLSHAPVIGTLIRLVYLFWLPYLFGFRLPSAFIVGLMAADILHWLMDWRIGRWIWKGEL